MSGLPKFWMSIIGDSSIQEQLVSTMRVADEEERALNLLTRTLFLIIMGEGVNFSQIFFSFYTTAVDDDDKLCVYEVSIQTLVRLSRDQV